jgi:lysophospholipase L1-like esterase
MIKFIIQLIFLNSLLTFSQSIHSNLEYLYPSEGLEFRYQEDWGRANYNKVIEQFKKKPLEKNDIVFLGNSITAGGNNWSKRLDYPKIKNRGIGGDVTDGVFARLEEIIHYKVKAIFLLIGINDIWNNGSPDIPSPEYIGTNIIKITHYLKMRSPKSRIYVQTVLPTEKEDLIESINTVNEIIKSSENKDFKVIDLHSIFVYEDGLINKEYTTDGVHLNEKGYEKWAEFIKPIVHSIK